MQPIRRYLFRKLAGTFGVVALVMLALAGMGLGKAFERKAGSSLREYQFSALAGIGILLLAFALWRLQRLAREFGNQLAAISTSAIALGEGRLPEPIVSGVKEIQTLSDALWKAGESIRNEADLRTQLERSQRLETMGCLAGGIAHDVNNQLASIVGQINLGRDLLPEGHPAAQRLDKAEHAADRCAVLVKSLLSFTHQVRPQLGSMDLNTLVVDTAALLERVLGGLIRIELSLAPGLPPILGNAVQLEQVLLNLAVNSRDAMPQGGRLMLSTELAGTGRVLLRVRDTGTGIPEDVRPRIFEPFFTTKAVGKGSGLGLATVFTIVKAHGGSIEVASQPSQGTEFRILLQMIEKPVQPGPGTASAPGPVRHFAGKRILVAEDDPNLRELLADAFTQARAQVETAQDGQVAWCLFQQSRYDLIISDQRMPECTGLELLARIRSAGSTVPMILASGYGLEGMEAQLAKDPRLKLFPKPFSIRNLFGSAWELLDDALAPD